MKNWTERLSGDVCNRLANCRSRKEDLPELVNAKWASMKEQGKDQEGFTKEDALVSILELLDCNGQWSLTDMTREEYDELKCDSQAPRKGANVNRKGLARNVITVYQGRGSFEPIIACTLWRRHDEEDLELHLKADTNRLINAYIDADKNCSFSILRQWKEYGSK